MKTEFLLGEELSLGQNQKDSTCISIIVPTNKLSHQRRLDHLEVEKALNRAKEYLRNNYGEHEVSALVQSLDELYNQIDFTRNTKGVGLFVSEHIKQLVLFHFPVKEKVMVSNAFETRDWLYQLYYARPYIVLLLMEKDAKLFEGRMNALVEIHDQLFPKKHEEAYESNRPSRGSSYVGSVYLKEFERDKSQLEEIQYSQFMEQVQNDLNRYLLNEVPLIVVGVRSDVAVFKTKTRQGVIAGEVYGNNLYSPLNELAEASWDALKFFLNRKKQLLILEFEEKIGEGIALSGLQECWEAAKEGRARTLIAEKDFVLAGFLSKQDDYHLYLHAPKEEHSVLPDAVNTLMDEVLGRGGNVVLVENGALDKYQRVAMITRY